MSVPIKLLNTLRRLDQETAAAIPLTFKATYKATGNASLTYAQMGSESAFSAGPMTYYSTGSSNAVCDLTNATPVCYSGIKPLTGLLSLVIPANTNRAIRALETIGASFVQSSQSATRGQCLAYQVSGQPVKYCIDSQGMITFISTPFGTFKLSGVTNQVSASDVSMPSS